MSRSRHVRLPNGPVTGCSPSSVTLTTRPSRSPNISGCESAPTGSYPAPSETPNSVWFSGSASGSPSTVTVTSEMEGS